MIKKRLRDLGYLDWLDEGVWKNKLCPLAKLFIETNLKKILEKKLDPLVFEMNNLGL
jgi:hypothetical protein